MVSSKMQGKSQVQKHCQPSIPYLMVSPFTDENGKGSEMNPAALPLKIRWRRFTKQKVNYVKINPNNLQGGKDGKRRNVTVNCPLNRW